ncbi:MAG: hypothetical protein QMC95_17205 [Desulfitobacteriaceae bacterium]|nr:hypothetical protein [Desulfitobacteriaceae bacterium]
MFDKIKDQLEEIKKYYNSISDDEFKQRLIKDGFEVIEGVPGQFLYEETDEDYLLCERPRVLEFTVNATEDLWETELSQAEFELDQLLGVA